MSFPPLCISTRRGRNQPAHMIWSQVLRKSRRTYLSRSPETWRAIMWERTICVILWWLITLSIRHFINKKLASLNPCEENKETESPCSMLRDHSIDCKRKSDLTGWRSVRQNKISSHEAFFNRAQATYCKAALKWVWNTTTYKSIPILRNLMIQNSLGI